MQFMETMAHRIQSDMEGSESVDVSNRLGSAWRMHPGHEPFSVRSSRRESAQTSPMKNERTHVRCYRVGRREIHAMPDCAEAKRW